MADNGQRVGVSPANPINDPSFSSRQGSNTFDLSFQNLLTCRYGEITPFFYMSGLGRDRLELRSSHELRTYTLGAPLMSGLRMRKSTFSVSKKAMMPHTFNYLFVNPVKGNDVPDDAYCFIDVVPLIKNICTLGYDYYSSYVSSLGSSNVNKSLYFERTIKAFVLLQNLCSSGSVLDNLGVSLSPVCKYITNSDIDLLSDTFVSRISSLLENNSLAIILSYNVNDPSSGESQDSVFRCVGTASSVFEFLQLVAQHPDCTITLSDSSSNVNLLESISNLSL